MTAALTTAEAHTRYLSTESSTAPSTASSTEPALAAGSQRASEHQRASEQELRRYLADCLQGPLEISALQQRLLHTLTRRLGLDGLHYHHAALALDIQLGIQAPHSCGYRILTSDEYLGELVFKRASQFNEQELQLIEAVIPAVVNPLRTSLRNR